MTHLHDFRSKTAVTLGHIHDTSADNLWNWSREGARLETVEDREGARFAMVEDRERARFATVEDRETAMVEDDLGVLVVAQPPQQLLDHLLLGLDLAVHQHQLKERGWSR